MTGGLPVAVLRPGARMRRVRGRAQGGAEALDLAARDGEAPIGYPKTHRGVWVVSVEAPCFTAGRYPGDPLDEEARARDLELEVAP